MPSKTEILNALRCLAEMDPSITCDECKERNCPYQDDGDCIVAVSKDAYDLMREELHGYSSRFIQVRDAASKRPMYISKDIILMVRPMERNSLADLVGINGSIIEMVGERKFYVREDPDTVYGLIRGEGYGV